MEVNNKFEVFYVGEQNDDKDNNIKEYVIKLFRDAYEIDAEFSYEDRTWGIRKGLQWRWLGFKLDKPLDLQQRTTAALSISKFLDGVLISQI